MGETNSKTPKEMKMLVGMSTTILNYRPNLKLKLLSLLMLTKAISLLLRKAPTLVKFGQIIPTCLWITLLQDHLNQRVDFCTVKSVSSILIPTRPTSWPITPDPRQHSWLFPYFHH